MSDMRVCGNDGEPLMFTMEFAGSEYHCVICGGHEDVFGDRAPATPERQLRLDALTAQYQRERAERTGRRAPPPAPLVGDPDVVAPVCQGCGEEPPIGGALYDGKPRAWFSRTPRGGETVYACSRACIEDGVMVLPW